MASIKKKISQATEGVLATAVNMALVTLFFNLEVLPVGRSRKRWQASEKAIEDFETINYESLKNAFLYLKRRGLIQTFKEQALLPKITAQGEEKLRAIIPQYQSERPWDGRLYLITYDLPVKKNSIRNSLRDYLKTIGAGMLQQSLWLTPYNPTLLLEKFVKEKRLSEDLILVSSLGKDGTIGEMELSGLMEKVFHLSEINLNYGQFIDSIRRGELSPQKAIFTYLAILDKDPQLPFPLLPKDWLGEEAHSLFKEVLRTNQNSVN